jgi:hypothetical protein
MKRKQGNPDLARFAETYVQAFQKLSPEEQTAARTEMLRAFRSPMSERRTLSSPPACRCHRSHAYRESRQRTHRWRASVPHLSTHNRSQGIRAKV